MENLHSFRSSCNAASDATNDLGLSCQSTSHYIANDVTNADSAVGTTITGDPRMRLERNFFDTFENDLGNSRSLRSVIVESTYDEPSTTTADADSFQQVSPQTLTTSSSSSTGSSHQSYIALISMAILSSPQKRLVLSDIYRSLSTMIPARYNNSSRAWRNSIRHNLSLNECFIKDGRAPNGKGNYWTIHPACVEDFARGDYRRRQARRRAVGGGGLQSACNMTDQWQGQNQAQIQVQSPEANRQRMDDATDFVPMSCVTVLTGFNNSLTPAEIVSMLPLPRDLFGTASIRNSGTSSL